MYPILFLTWTTAMFKFRQLLMYYNSNFITVQCSYFSSRLKILNAFDEHYLKGII